MEYVICTCACLYIHSCEDRPGRTLCCEPRVRRYAFIGMDLRLHQSFARCKNNWLVVFRHPVLKNDGVRQLGWWKQPNINGKKCQKWQPNHQPVNEWSPHGAREFRQPSFQPSQTSAILPEMEALHESNCESQATDAKLSKSGCDGLVYIPFHGSMIPWFHKHFYCQEYHEKQYIINIWSLNHVL